MSQLNGIDYTVIVIYFGILVGLGLYLQKKASASLEDYFLGGRNLPWWALGISGMASWLDITGTMLITSFLFMLGPRGLFVEFRGGAGLVMICMLLWAGKWHRRSGCITGAEWNIFRFGDGFGGQFARLSGVFAQVVFTAGALAYLVKGVGLFLSMFVPFSPSTCALVMLTVATIYTMASGFYGVVFTDMFQSGIILIAVVTISILALGRIESLAALGELAQQVTGSEQWTTASLQWHTDLPAGYEIYESLGAFALFYLFQQIFLSSSQGGDPKYFGARNDRECGLLSFMWATLMVFRWPLMMGFAILGLFLIQGMYPDESVLAQSADLIRTHIGDIDNSRWGDVIAGIIHRPGEYPPALIEGLRNVLGAEQWATKLNMLSFHGTVNPERILPAVILYNIPMGFRGLILIALIAASMSTFDTIVNASAGFFVRDLYQRYLRPKSSTRELMMASYGYIFVVVVIGFWFGYRVESIHSVWTWITAGFWGAMLAPSFLRLYWWRFNGSGLATGMVSGLLASIGVQMLSGRYEVLGDPKIMFVVILAIGVAGCVIGSYLYPPTDRKVLENFYRKTKPFGLWGPLKHIIPEHERAIMRKEHRNDLLALPFTVMWHVSWLMLPMTLMIRNFKAAGVWGAIWAIGLLGMYLFWYRNLPKDNFYPDELQGQGQDIVESACPVAD